MLIFAGAVMLFGAVESTGGLIAIAAGIAIELVGIALEKRTPKPGGAGNGQGTARKRTAAGSQRDNGKAPRKR
ncbi:MAG: hypothetical protein ABI728_04115 [Betaproteobacteria bacterium]